MYCYVWQPVTAADAMIAFLLVGHSSIKTSGAAAMAMEVCFNAYVVQLLQEWLLSLVSLSINQHGSADFAISRCWNVNCISCLVKEGSNQSNQ